jgi:hypothetical protein
MHRIALATRATDDEVDQAMLNGMDRDRYRPEESTR